MKSCKLALTNGTMDELRKALGSIGEVFPDDGVTLSLYDTGREVCFQRQSEQGQRTIEPDILSQSALDNIWSVLRGDDPIKAATPTKDRVFNCAGDTILITGTINAIAHRVHKLNLRWWFHPVTGDRINRNVGEMLMLVVSEIAEAMEGHRKSLMDTHLLDREMIEVELADAVIRIFDIAHGLNMDLGGAIAEKLMYNSEREDHKIEARLLPNGKKY